MMTLHASSAHLKHEDNYYTLFSFTTESSFLIWLARSEARFLYVKSSDLQRKIESTQSVTSHEFLPWRTGKQVVICTIDIISFMVCLSEWKFI